MPAFDRDIVQRAYVDLEYRHGWTFMMTPEPTMREANVAMIGLNPGGGGEGDTDQYDGVWAVESGNAYYDPWSAGAPPTPIQTQIQHWHHELDIDRQGSFCAQFVPFRSPSWVKLERKQEALNFSMRLWKWTLDNSRATLLITMGKGPARYLSQLLEARRVERLQAGWGKQTIDVHEGSGYRIVAMPHPSRFQLFGRASKSEVAQASFKKAVGWDGRSSLPA